MNSKFRLSVLAGCFALLACEPSSSDVIVARAADRTLTVDQVVRILGSRSDLPNEPRVVAAVADLWIDYTLFAHALAQDSTLSQLDFDPLVQPQLEQEMIFTLRDSAIDADTAISQAQLAELYEIAAPGAQARARHILLTLPQAPTQEQRDSVRAEVEALRQRILAGESFEELARRFSQDRASGERGGDLGRFERGQLVRPLDDAIFELEVGEVGEVVESPYGYHVVRLDELSTPRLDSIPPGFRAQVQERRFQEAESTFIAALQETGALRPVAEAAELVRQVARDPQMALSGRAADRPVVRYTGGTVTLEEVREFIQSRPPDYRAQIIEAPDEIIREQLLVSLAQRELLISEAVARGLEPGESRRDSLADMARSQFVAAGEALGLAGLEVSGSGPDEITDAVRAALASIVSGEQEPLPLGPIAFVLRSEYRASLNEAGVSTAVARLEEIRGTPAGPAAAPAPRPSPPPIDTAAVISPPDTAG